MVQERHGFLLVCFVSYCVFSPVHTQGDDHKVELLSPLLVV